jgi:predicted kinase
MATVTLTVGVSACGKTTWARAKAQEVRAVVVSRDDIRIAQGLVHGQDEDLVTDISRMQIEAALMYGYDVIVADTNLAARFRNQLIIFCIGLGADVKIKVFTVDYDTAVERDRLRSASVGAKVIRNQMDMLESQDIKDEYISGAYSGRV